MPGTLYLVATPIGNMEDLGGRARRILAEVDLIACEDTRHTAKLLSHLGLSTPTVSCHEHNEGTRAGELVAKLEAGANIALVTDAGTPAISDPGFRVVREAIKSSINVVSIPGPCAAVAALAASGLPPGRFLFAGFLSAKRSQFRKQLNEMLNLAAGSTMILYEAPHRILQTLADIAETLGPDHPVVVARELTKLHEEVLRGPVSVIRGQLADRASIKGEITLLIGPPPEKAAAAPDEEALREEVASLVTSGTSRMGAIKEVARKYGMPKRELYRLIG